MGKLHEFLIILRIQINLTVYHEDNFFCFFANRLYDSAWKVLTSVHPDNELISETDLTRVEEVLESLDELVKDFLYQFSLHLRSQLLVQLVLFNDQVIIRAEGLLDSFLDSLRQFRWHVVWLVTALDSLHPEVHLI